MDFLGKKIAILWGSGLGDLLVMRPYFNAVFRTCRTTPLLITTERSYSPQVINELSAKLDVCLLPSNPLKAIKRLCSLGSIDYVYYGPQNTFKSKLLSYFIPRAKSLKSKSTATFLADAIVEDAKLLNHEGHNLKPYGDRPLFRRTKSHIHMTNLKKFILIHAATKKDWKTHSWPPEKWISLITRLSDLELNIILVGTRKESHLLERIKTGIKNKNEKIFIKCDLGLAKLEEIVSRAVLAICHNSGVMHIAVANHVPTVILNGSSAHYWRPQYPWTQNIVGPCNKACNKYICPDPKLNAKCIKDISVNDVFMACIELLK